MQLGRRFWRRHSPRTALHYVQTWNGACVRRRGFLLPHRAAVRWADGRQDYATGPRGPWTPLRVPEVISLEQPVFLRDTSGKINTKLPSLRRHRVFSEGGNILQLPNDFLEILRYAQTQRSPDHPHAPYPGPQQPVLTQVEHWIYIFSKTYAFGNINQVL